jgi:hypothetical protein
LTATERGWVFTQGIIAESKKEGFTNHAHGIYKGIAIEVNEVMNRPSHLYAEAFQDLAYYNYFQRPATMVPIPGERGLSLHVEPLDCEVADKVFKWVVRELLKPDILVFTSRFAGKSCKALRGLQIPYGIAPHPTSRWWNMKAAAYGGLTGRELFRKTLCDNRFICK